jgi:hypothetical protein
VDDGAPQYQALVNREASMFCHALPFLSAAVLALPFSHDSPGAVNGN